MALPQLADRLVDPAPAGRPRPWPPRPTAPTAAGCCRRAASKLRRADPSASSASARSAGTATSRGAVSSSSSTSTSSPADTPAASAVLGAERDHERPAHDRHGAAVGVRAHRHAHGRSLAGGEVGDHLLRHPQTRRGLPAQHHRRPEPHGPSMPVGVSPGPDFRAFAPGAVLRRGSPGQAPSRADSSSTHRSSEAAEVGQELLVLVRGVGRGDGARQHLVELRGLHPVQHHLVDVRQERRQNSW